MKTVKMAVVVLGCALLAGASTHAREMVMVRVSPNLSMAPATVRVVVTVEPDADNRQLEIVADSGEFYTSSTVQLDGTKAPRLQSFLLKELPAGDYVVSARVTQRNGGSRQATAEYQVLE